MSPVVRIWLGLLALGAAIVHLGMASGAPVALAVVLGLVAAAEGTWGVACLAHGTPPWPRAALIGALVPLVAWVVALLVANAAHLTTVLPELRPLPLATASLFDVGVAVGIALWIRRGSRPARPDPRPIRFLVGVAAGALVVAALATPALAATRAGEGAPEHHFDFDQHHPGG